MKPMNDEQIIELISRRRRQILVHSYLYYEKDANLISDSTWSEWAIELVDIQNRYPSLAAQAPYYEAFKNFDGSTGFDLPFRLPNIISTAEHLLAYCNKI